uniref:T cell receptor beta joining 2-4 n=4 Tax=Homo sapiens TaxID=9606 RepID=TJB24_HUMAN
AKNIQYFGAGTRLSVL